MKLRFVLSLAFLLTVCLFTANDLKAQEFPSNLLQKIPDAAEKLQSDNVTRRAKILFEIVKPVPLSCTGEKRLPIDLQKADYDFIVAKILEKDLSDLDENQKYDIWSNLTYLIQKFEMNWTAGPISHYLTSREWQVQANVISVLKALNARQFDGELAELLSSPNQYIRDETLRTLIELRSKKAAPTLVAKLTDENASQRYWAIQKLIEIGAKEAASKIAERLKDEDQDIPYWAIDALGQLDAKAQSKELWQFLRSSSDERYRGFAIATLVLLEQKEAIPIAIDHLKRISKTGTQDNVWEFLDKLKPKLLIPTLISLYNSKFPFFEAETDEKKFRWQLLQKLVNYRTPLAIPIYRENLIDRSDGGKPNSYVARILQELNATEAIDDVITLFNDSAKSGPGTDADYRAGELGIILAKFGDVKTWKLLLDYVEKTKFYNRDRIISEMNRHLNPKLWDKMHAKIPAQVPARPVKTVAAMISRESGIPLSLENIPKSEPVLCKPEDSEETDGIPCGYATGRDSLYDVVAVLTAMLNQEKRGTYTFIFDNGTIRILKVENAVEWWKKNILAKTR